MTQRWGCRLPGYHFIFHPFLLEKHDLPALKGLADKFFILKIRELCPVK